MDTREIPKINIGPDTCKKKEERKAQKNIYIDKKNTGNGDGKK